MRQNKFGLFAVPGVVIAIVVMLVIPLPTFVLDVLISLNITAAAVIMLMSMHVKRPLDFSVFPALLLVATLFRLALNIAATRLILLHAYAGTVIESFGHFVVGSSIVVGLVVFLILIVIQFVVVTNGAGRVAEVAARFTLDAMPGKQMAIDADLNAGLINEAEARRRRREINDEADFYGAMDGASKFVRGDAIAAVVIVTINLIGGFIVGVVQHHLSFSQSIHTYSLLSIGDGLVSQIPALLLSISTGLIVTRASTDDDFGTDVVRQFTSQYRAIQIAGGVLLALAIIPGLPHVAFLVVGGGVLLLGLQVGNRFKRDQEKQAREALPQPPPTDTPEALAKEMRVEPIELELAVDLVELVDPARGGEILERVKALRRKVANETGLIVPPVRTRDNVSLPLHTYAIKVHGVEVARGEAPPGKVLAIGNRIDALPGEPTQEPVFGLPAKWIPAELRQEALMSGATVVDRPSVITTHLSEVIHRYGHQLLSAQQVKTLLDVLRQSDPALIEEIGSAQLSVGEIQRVLCALLEEQVPIRDLARILEAVALRAKQTHDADALIEAARLSVAPSITSAYSEDGVLPVITIDAAFEQELADSLKPSESGMNLVLSPTTLESLVKQVTQLAQEAEEAGRRPVLVCSPQLRPALHRLLSPVVPRLPIVSVSEITPVVRPERVGVVNPSDAPATV
jgi:flagellar biosynthesis protein FlhA